MIHLANILIVTDDNSLSHDLASKLKQHRYEAQTVVSQQEALAEAEQERPDIILLGGSFKGGDPTTLARIFKASPTMSDIPICLVAYAPSSELQNRALASGMADVLTPPISTGKLIARLRPLVRLSSMQVELQQRTIAAQRFGVALPNAVPLRRREDREDNILLIGSNTDNIAKHLPNANLSLAADPFQADSAFEKQNFDAAIALLDGEPTPYLDLCLQTRNNPRLFDLPLILVSDPQKIDEETAYQHGVSGYFSAPADPYELNNATMFLVKRQRQRWAIREALADAAHMMLRDPDTGLYSRSFVDSYLTQRVDYALNHGRALSVAFFRVPDIEHVRTRFGDEQANHLRLQVSQWVTRLLRVEDLTARYDENEFCVILPDSPQSEASFVINRITGVLAYTDFAVRDVFEPVKVWVRVGSAELIESDTAESLILRARQTITE